MEERVLTLDLLENNTGYVINLNGTPWIKQEGYYPYDGVDIKSKGLAHIKAILAEWSQPAPLTVEERLKNAEEMIDFLTMGGF